MTDTYEQASRPTAWPTYFGAQAVLSDYEAFTGTLTENNMSTIAKSA